MPIRVTEKNKTTRKPNYLEAAALGASAGYSAKYLIPVTSAEKDSRYTAYLAGVNKDAKATKINAFKAMQALAKKPAYTDEFCAAYENKKLTLNSIKKLDADKKEQFLSFISDLNQISRNVRQDGCETLKILTKKMRPADTFIFIGTGLALAFTFCKNAFKKTSGD